MKGGGRPKRSRLVDTSWGHIRQRGDAFQLIWYENGRQKSRTVRGTEAEASAVLANIHAGLASGDYMTPSKETVGAYLVRWLADTKPSVAPKTYRSYETNCRVHIIPAIGHIRLSELKPMQIQSFYATLGRKVYEKKDDKGKVIWSRPISPDTLATVHRILRAALNRAVALWLLPRTRNPIDGVVASQPAEKDHHILTVEEAGRLLEVSRPTGRYSLYLASLATGLRQSELLGLRWENVDLNRGTLSVTQQLAASGASTSFREPKSRKGKRVLEIPEILLEALKFDHAVYLIGREKPHFQYDFGLVWHVDNGRPISQRNLDRQFQGLLTKAKLPHMDFHSLRATHSSWQSIMGLNLADLKTHLGHGDVKTTMRYTKPSPHAERVAADNIDKLLGGQSK